MPDELAVAAGEGEHGADIVQQFDAQARAVGDPDVAVLDFKRLLHLFVQAAVSVVVQRVFLDLEVGNAGIQLQAGGGGDGPQRVMGDDVDRLCLGQSGDLLARRDAARHAHIGADILHLGSVHELVELHQVDEPFAGSHRQVDLIDELRHGGHVVGNRVLVEVGPVLLQGVGALHSLSRGQAPVALDGNVHLPAHGLADGGQLALHPADHLRESLAAAAILVFGVADGVADGGVALIFQSQSLFCKVLGGLGLEVDIDAGLVAHLAAQQFIDGGIVVLALQVPQGNVDAGDGGGHHRAAEVHTAGQAVVDVLNIQRIQADEVVLHGVDALSGGLLIAPGTALAVAHQPGVSVDFDKEVAHAGQNGFDFCDLHKVPPIRMRGRRS